MAKRPRTIATIPGTQGKSAPLKARPTILAAMDHPSLFGPWFTGPTWDAWRAVLAALFALPMTEAQSAIYHTCTGRTHPPAKAFREAALICGRRGGKSRIAAVIATFVAVFVDFTKYLTPGKPGVVMVLAADRSQARVILSYVSAFFDEIPALASLVVTRTQESITLSNGLSIEIHTSSFRSVRGRTVVCALLDELAFWASDESSANPDSEVLAAIRPAMATIPTALLLMLSSPYARRGVLYETHRKHFGRDDSPVLVVKAPTEVVNPGVDPAIIAAAYEEDPTSAAAEYGAEFRSDVEAFLAREVVDSLVIPGRAELPPVPRVSYVAFIDPSGGSQDSMTLAIAHVRDGIAVLDCIRERRPPFSPDDVVQDFVTTLKAYGCAHVTGDAWGGEWVRESFRKWGVGYTLSDLVKSSIYRESLPHLNSKRVELLDNPRLIAQLCSLERRVARGGRDSIDHPPGQHDDVGNAACGAITRALGVGGSSFGILEYYRREVEKQQRAASA